MWGGGGGSGVDWGKWRRTEGEVEAEGQAQLTCQVSRLILFGRAIKKVKTCEETLQINFLSSSDKIQETYLIRTIVTIPCRSAFVEHQRSALGAPFFNGHWGLWELD